LLEVMSDDTLRRVPGQTMGNKHYAWCQEARIKQAVDFLAGRSGTLLWLTLTAPYEKTQEGRIASWKAVQARLQSFLRAIRRLGVDHYITVKEAHLEGGCHVHASLAFPEKLSYKKDRKGKLRLVGLRGRQVRDALKAAWGAGHIDVQVARDGGAAKYLVKELGKAGHIEDALRRAERGWDRDEEAKYQSRDIKKLWTVYFASSLHIRRLTMSRSIRAAIGGGEAGEAEPDLINNRTNSTDPPGKPRVVRVIPLPWEVRRQAWYQPFFGFVEPGSEEDRHLRQIYKINPG